MNRSQIGLALALGTAIAASAARADPDFNKIERGRYLVDAGDCYACHTQDPAKPFAGGRPLATPFGTVYSANITPDPDAGIGSWSDDQFYRAMHDGVSADGHRLYPAFPYPYYTHVSREDVDAIRAYLATIPASSDRPPPNSLPFPLDERVVMRAWNWMFFDAGTFHPDPGKSPEWNRGAYLVEGLGHCGACHTPKGVLGQDKGAQDLQGGNLENWFAPNLGPDLRTGLGAWSVQDLTTYLSTGRNRFANSTGPMSEVIEYSTSRLTSPDLVAIATYLKDLPKPKSSGTTGSGAQPEAAVATAGEAIFLDQCAACHRSNGQGVPSYFPPLAGNSEVQQADPTNAIRAVLEGARSTPTDAKPTPLTMPPFDWKLSDAQVAAVVSYVRTHWGNAASVVSADKVSELRKKVGQNSDAR